MDLDYTMGALSSEHNTKSKDIVWLFWWIFLFERCVLKINLISLECLFASLVNGATFVRNMQMLGEQQSYFSGFL